MLKNYAAKHKEFMASPPLPFYQYEYALQRSRVHFPEKLLPSDAWFYGSRCFS